MIGIPLPAAVLPSSMREIAVLRTLGRLGVVAGPVLFAFIMPDLRRSARYEIMQRLIKRGLVWRAETPATMAPAAELATRPLRNAGVYGLTGDGKQHLDALQAEPQGDSFNRLLARDRRAPPPGAAALVADTLIAAWCASVIDAARQSPLLVGVTCQARYVTVEGGAGQAQQVIGAVLSLAFAAQPREMTRVPWQIPWMDGEAPATGVRIVRFALEVDTGYATTASIIQQARLYAILNQQNYYARLFGGAIRPVLITPPGDRANQVAAAWRDGWPDTPAVISSTIKAQHPEYGALWGTYYTIKDTPPQQQPLLTGLVPTVEQWARLVRAATPQPPAIAGRRGGSVAG